MRNVTAAHPTNNLSYDRSKPNLCFEPGVYSWAHCSPSCVLLTHILKANRSLGKDVVHLSALGTECAYNLAELRSLNREYLLDMCVSLECVLI